MLAERLSRTRKLVRPHVIHALASIHIARDGNHHFEILRRHGSQLGLYLLREPFVVVIEKRNPGRGSQLDADIPGLCCAYTFLKRHDLKSRILKEAQRGYGLKVGTVDDD